MNRKDFESPFSRTALPSWRCPSCASGALAIVKNSLHTEETKESKNAHSHPDWEPDRIDQHFSALLRCVKCSEPVFIIGKTQMMEAYDDEYGWGLEEGLVPLYFHSPPPIIECPRKTPESIFKEIREAGRLYWASPSSSGNRLRVAVEKLMDHLKIPRKGKTKNGRILPLTLHARLERYEKQNADVASKLLAVKWLGNIGSHTGELAHSDVLDAFELVSFALDEVFEKKSDRLKRMAEKIIRHKGPSGAKSR